MQDLPVLLAIAGISVMGVGAIAKTAFVTAQFGIFELTAAGRSDLSFVIVPPFLVVLVLLTNRSQQETTGDKSMTTPVDSPGRFGDSMLGSAAWGRANGGRLTPAEQCRFAMQTVVAQLRLQWQDRGAVSDDMRQRWSRLEPDRVELPGTPTVARALDRATAVRGHATASETCSGYSHAGRRLLWRMGFERAIRRSIWQE